MPSKITGISSSLVLTIAAVSAVHAQVPAQQTAAIQPPAQVTATSGDVMRDRISKAKAYIVVRNYNAAIYELENIRKESADPAVRSVVNVLLMNSYLEQGDYKRAQEFLNQYYGEQRTSKAGAADTYASLAGQVIKSARNRAERFKALGLNISDRTLPLEALNDLEKMRETVEIVITQAKEIGKNPARTRDAMALLEEATNSRTAIARDDYDAKRWKDEVADTREDIASSRSVVLNAVDGKPEPNIITVSADQVNVAANTTPAIQAPQTTQSNTAPSVRARQVTYQPDPAPAQTVNNPATQAAKAEPIAAPTSGTAAEPKKEEPKPEPSKAVADNSAVTGPLEVGATLASYATKQQNPVYPSMAKTLRTTGLVKVEVTVDESGQVAEVHKASGPSMLQAAAKDAIKKWRFKPFTRDGQPVKATGFVNFSFAL